MRIKSISYEYYEGDVYNFHCDPNENYFANGMLVHNCYKGNGTAIEETRNMSLETFKKLLVNIDPYKILTQIAFGITDINTNPDFWSILEYTRSKGIIPNYTTNGFDVTEEVAKKTKELCGAVAVSIHNKPVAYDAIRKFISAGMKQVNIHFVLAQETLFSAYKLVDDVVSDERLKGMNAIVFLGYKHKNLNSKFHYLDDLNDYKELIDYCKEKNVRFGFDSCSAANYLKIIEGTEDEKTSVYAEPCESGLFSSYFNVNGEFFPCSFMEGKDDWTEGIDAVNCNDFIKEIWNAEKVIQWRNKLKNSSNCQGCSECKMKANCRSCFAYPETAICKRKNNGK